MKRFLTVLLSLTFVLTAACGCSAQSASYEKYTRYIFDYFDTVTQIIGYAKDSQTFDRVTDAARDELERLHRAFDAYTLYDGVGNVCYVNQNAAAGPVRAEPELIDLLLFCKEQQALFPGKVNVAMGAVLSIWHDYREEGVALPDMDELQAAAAHCDFDDVIIDEEAGTIYFADPELTLDVGSVAKGFAVERVAQMMLASDMPSFLISAGGNVRTGEAPLDGRLYWGTSIRNPDSDETDTLSATEGILDVMYFTDGSAVTSGDYQRYYIVDGERYHHIIDPQTLMPSDHVRSVTVYTRDSGMADFLSTTLFLSSYEEGRALADSLEGVEAYWVLPDGSIEMTDGMRSILYSCGASASVEHETL